MKRRENQDIIAQINQSDRFLRIGVVTTSFILIALAVFTLVNVLRITAKLEREVQERSKQTQTIVEQIRDENEHSHGELLKFVKCISTIPPAQRVPGDIDKCISETDLPVGDDEGGTTSSSTVQTTPSTPQSNGTPSNSQPAQPSNSSQNATPAEPEQPSPNPITQPVEFIQEQIRRLL